MRSLAVVGNVNVDLIIGPIADWPVPGSEVIVAHDELRVGGSAGNASLAWSALGIDHQIAANTGSDQYGSWLKSAFGTRSAAWPDSQGNTTLSVGITHTNGERTFFTTQGHLLRFDWPSVRAMIDWEKLSGGVLLLCGSFLTDQLTACYGDLFAQAEAHGIDIALDTGWPLDGWTASARAATREWLANSAWALVNEAEAIGISGQENIDEAGRWLRQAMPAGASVVIKRGAEGVTAFDASGKVTQVQAPKVQIVDTIGAGDIFNAAFLAELARGMPLEKCLEQGVATASLAIATHPRRYGPLGSDQNI